ncbi:MFS transporter [Massilia sp. TN1-12]|uniref:MFS transporter n=1 Tax=Massilia paldalensis TaxID=3377675 RepID=UPI00384E0EE2
MPLLLTASLGCAVTVLDTNLVGIVLPTIARDLNATFGDIEWVISTYLLCFAALLLPAGVVADRIGRKRLLLLGLFIFGLASLACGVAGSAQALYLARAGQGAGAACLLAPSLAVIGHAFRGEQERARVWAFWGAIMGTTMVLSPLVGGVISRWLGWRWAFYVNLPACAVLGLAVVRWIPESRSPVPRPFDIPGIVLFASAMFTFTWTLISGPAEGWTSMPVLVRAAAALCMLGCFLAAERRVAQPMLDLELFANTRFVGAVIAMLAYAGAAQVMASLLPLYLQNARGATALEAGAGMLPFALAMLLLPMLGRRLGAFMAGYQILALGLAIVALGNLVMMWAASMPGLRALDVLGMAILGSGGGLLNGETQKAIMGAIPADRAGMASGISTTSRFCGILLGFASLGAVLSSGTRATLLAGLPRLGQQARPELIEQLVAGDVTGAAGTGGAMPAGLAALLQHGFETGFAHAFLAAAAASALGCVVVYGCMGGARS